MAKGFNLSTTFSAIDRLSGPGKTIFGKLSRGAKDTNQALAGAARGLRNIAKIATAGAVIGVGLVTKGLIDLAKQGDEIAKTSRQIGLGAEALQELRFAADRQGISNEVLTKSLKLLNRNVGDLRAGTGTLTTFLKKTNPALAEQLKNVTSSEQAFELLVGEIEKLPDQMDKAALAQAAFGRSGQDIIKIAEVGVEGIAALREEARKYGDIITEKAAKGSEKFVDAMTNARAALRGLRNQGLAPLIEKLTPFIQKFADWVAANKELIQQRIQKVFGKIKSAVQDALPVIRRLINAFIWLKDNWGLVVAGILGIKAAQIGLNAVMAANPVGAVVASLVALVAIAVLVVKHWDAITEAIANAWNWFDKLLGNPWIRLGLSLVAQPILAIAAAIRIVIDLVSGKGLGESLLNLTDPLGGIWAAGRAAAGVLGLGSGQSSQIGTPVSSNAGLIETLRTARSVVDINFNGTPPAGTTARQTGHAPGATVNTGPAFQGAGASAGF